MILAFLAVVVVSVLGGVSAWLAAGRFGNRYEAIDTTTPGRAAVVAYVVFYIAGSLVLIVTGDSRGAGPLLAAGALAAFGVGAVVARRAFGRMPVMPPSSPGGYRILPVAVLAVVGVVAISYLIARNGVPLLSADPQASRTGFGGLLFDVFRWLVPPSALVALGVAVTRGRRRDVLIAAAGLLGVGGLEILLASRALPFELGIEALLIAWWAGRRPSKRIWVGVATAGLIVFVGVQLIRIGPQGGFSGTSDAAGFVVRRTVDRVLLIHPMTLEVVAARIPSRRPYFGGSTYVRWLAPLFGKPLQPALGYELYRRLFPRQPGGFAAPGVAGEAWANAGPILVAIIMAALGALAVWLGVVIGRLPGGPADRAFAAIVVVAVARTYATSLNGFLLTLGVTVGWWLLASRRGDRERPPLDAG